MTIRDSAVSPSRLHFPIKREQCLQGLSRRLLPFFSTVTLYVLFIMATVWLDTLVLMFSPACCHSGAKRGGWICIILSRVHSNDPSWRILWHIPPDPDYFVKLAFKLYWLAFDSFCQLPLSVWLISTIKRDTLKCRIDAWVRILKLSFLYQSFETVLVARYRKIF